MMPDAAVSAAIAQIAASIETVSAPRRRFPAWRQAGLPWTQICQHERSGDQLERQDRLTGPKTSSYLFQGVARKAWGVGRSVGGGNVGEGREDPRPAAVAIDALSHQLPTLAVSFESSVHQRHPGALDTLGSEAHIDPAGPIGIGLGTE